MSTRATYQIADQIAGTHTFYIHYDGYPEGAAEYFWNMMHAENRGGGMPSQFLRANELAELTQGHDAHVDTEYRYTVDHTGFLKAQKRTGWDGDRFTVPTARWETFFTGHVCEFINQYGDFDKFAPVPLHGGVFWTTRPQLEAKIAKAQAALDNYKAKFPQYVGNIASMQSSLNALRAALDAFPA